MTLVLPLTFQSTLTGGLFPFLGLFPPSERRAWAGPTLKVFLALTLVSGGRELPSGLSKQEALVKSLRGRGFASEHVKPWV